MLVAEEVGVHSPVAEGVGVHTLVVCVGQNQLEVDLQRVYILKNYWMRLSMIWWIIKTGVCVICRSQRPRQIKQTQSFDHSWYHAKTKFNNCFITHVSHNSSQKQKRNVQPICFWGEHSKGLSNQADVELDMINAISAAADIALITSSSCQAIVNWLSECSRPIRFFIVSITYNK